MNDKEYYNKNKKLPERDFYVKYKVSRWNQVLLERFSSVEIFKSKSMEGALQQFEEWKERVCETPVTQISPSILYRVDNEIINIVDTLDGGGISLVDVLDEDEEESN